MNKKFALSLIASAVISVGCSSSDNPTNGEDVITAPIATPGVGTTAFDSVANSPFHTILEEAITVSGLADDLDNPDSSFTIFAPTDDAFTALDNDGDDSTLTTAQLLEEANRDELVRLLQYHVIQGSTTATQLSEAITNTGNQSIDLNTLLVDGDTAQAINVAISDAEFGLSVNGAGISVIDVTEEGADEADGMVQVLDSVLLPPAAPVVPVENTDPEPEPETPTTPVVTVGAGQVQGALEAGGSHSNFLSTFATSFGLRKLDAAEDVDPWTVFAPTDAALGGEVLTVVDHIVTGQAITCCTINYHFWWRSTCCWWYCRCSDHWRFSRISSWPGRKHHLHHSRCITLICS